MTGSTESREEVLPEFDDIPPVEGIDFKGCAWGLFDGQGTKDQLGTLNLLTSSRVLEAARQEIQCGEQVSLNLELHTLRSPAFDRKAFQHELINLSSIGFYGFDEEFIFNPQVGSHWNSFLHLAHQPSKTYYNGLKHIDFTERSDLRNGIDNASNKGICGRGVLLDWYSWAIRQGRHLVPNERTEILPSELDQVAIEQKVEFKVGDILLIRTGFISWYSTATEEERRKGTAEASNFLGIQASTNCFKWHWNHHFSAVAADNLTYEAWPPSQPLLHEYLLTMAGTMIGKLWDLERLARICQEKQKWTFFLSSSPLNITHGISSPANAIALF